MTGELFEIASDAFSPRNSVELTVSVDHDDPLYSEYFKSKSVAL